MVWSAPEVIRSLADGRVDAERVAVGMDGVGRAMVLYGETSVDNPKEETVYARHRAVQGAWGDPVPVWQTVVRRAEASYLTLSVGANGYALAAGRRISNYGRPARMAAYDPNTGWQAPVQPLDPHQGGVDPPTVAVGPDGQGLAVWESDETGANGLRARSWAPATGWGPNEVAAAALDFARAYKLAVNAHGQALLTYGQGDYSEVYAQFRSADGAWSPPRRLARRGNDSFWLVNPQPALNAAGDAWVTWSNSKRRGPVRTVVISSFDRLTLKWLETPVSLSAPGVDAQDPVLRLNEQGQMLVGWHHVGRYYPHRERVQNRLYTPTQGWGPVTDLSRLGRSSGPPGVALDEAGNATTVWPQITPGRGWHLHTLAQPMDAPAVSGRLHANGSVAEGPWQMADGDGRHAIVVFTRPADAGSTELVSQIGQLGECPP